MRLRVGLLAAVLATGCAAPVTGSPVADPRASAPQPGSPAPQSSEARWMNRFCGIGTLLVTAAETDQAPTVSGDPAVLKEEFLDTTGRLLGVLDAVLSDLRALVPAPAPEVDAGIGALTDGIADSRTAIGTARDDVAAADPLTVEVYAGAVDRFGTAMRGFEDAVTALGELELPDQLLDAAQAAPNCA